MAQSCISYIWPKAAFLTYGPKLHLHFLHMAQSCISYIWPIAAFLTYGPKLHFLHMAQSCISYIWPKAAFLTYGPKLHFLHMAQSCISYIWPKTIALALSILGRIPQTTFWKYLISTTYGFMGEIRKKIFIFLLSGLCLPSFSGTNNNKMYLGQSRNLYI